MFFIFKCFETFSHSTPESSYTATGVSNGSCMAGGAVKNVFFRSLHGFVERITLRRAEHKKEINKKREEIIHDLDFRNSLHRKKKETTQTTTRIRAHLNPSKVYYYFISNEHSKRLFTKIKTKVRKHLTHYIK